MFNNDLGMYVFKYIYTYVSPATMVTYNNYMLQV